MLHDAWRPSRGPVRLLPHERERKDRAEFLGLQGHIIITAHRAFVSGCEGPSIAVLRSVARRVARETQSSYLILITK